MGSRKNIGRHDLYGNEAVQIGGAGSVNHAHVTFTELFGDLRMVERLADEGIRPPY